jgi:hypothetical protein
MVCLNIKCYITRSNCSIILAIRIWVYKNARTAATMLLLSVRIFFVVVVCIQNVLKIGQVYQSLNDGVRHTHAHMRKHALLYAETKHGSLRNLLFSF